MKLINVEKIDFNEVFNSGSKFDKEAIKKAEKYIAEQPVIEERMDTGVIVLYTAAIAIISLILSIIIL